MILQPVTDASIIFLSVVFSNMKLNIDVSETSLTMEVPAITSPRISCRQTARVDAYEEHRCIKDNVKKCFILSKMCFRQLTSSTAPGLGFLRGVISSYLSLFISRREDANYQTCLYKQL